MGNNVTAAKPKVGGAIYVAPAGTTLPTDATTALASAFKGLGYISEDGFKNTTEITSEAIKAFGGDEVLNAFQGRADGFTYTLLEALNLEVLKEVYGAGNVTGALSTGVTIEVKAAEELPEHVIVAELVLKGGILKRIVVPAGVVSGVGDVVYADSSAVGYETTIKALADEDGVTHYEYIKQPTNHQAQ